MSTTWGIKLGSGCVFGEWCRKQKPPVIGLGWPDINLEKALKGDLEGLKEDLRKAYPQDKPRQIGSSAGILFSFAYKAQPDDFVWHYDPNSGLAYLSKIKSAAKERDFALSEEAVDIWHVREVELGPSMPLGHLHGDIVASLRFPKLSFWSMNYIHQETERIWDSKSALGISPSETVAFKNAYVELTRLMQKRIRVLDYKDWEILIKEYLEKQGGKIIGLVGSNREGIDVEALFSRGLLPPSRVRVQVKRYTDMQVDWPEIEEYVNRYGEASDFVFVSAFGFTPEAKKKADEENVVLLDDKDMSRFLLANESASELDQKLGVRGVLSTR
jgi:predicted Mrr-cat superfamily restriction endonuclease